MSFILRIFFSGLIVFIPNTNGKQVTVLLLSSAHHMPVLLARAAACNGDCPAPDVPTSEFLFPDSTGTAAVDSVKNALGGGSAWPLDASNLAFGIPDDGTRLVHSASTGRKSVPDNPAELADFDWVANLQQIDPGIGPIDPAVFGAHPPEDLVVARLVLTSGQISTYSVAQINGKVSPVDFRPLANDGKQHYSRAAATWVEAEIRVPGTELEITESTFDGKGKRSMSLSPIDGVVDVAVLNTARPLRPLKGHTPEPGAHFDAFWNLAQHPPAAGQRAIPQVPRARVATRELAVLQLDGSRPKTSPLIKEIFFHDGRDPYDQLLCPMSQYVYP